MNETLAGICICGNCDSDWIDPEHEDYLDTHFECEGCGSDFPMSTVVIDRYSDYEGHHSLYFCQKCSG